MEGPKNVVVDRHLLVEILGDVPSSLSALIADWPADACRQRCLLWWFLAFALSWW
jgi:hypothetical protein